MADASSDAAPQQPVSTRKPDEPERLTYSSSELLRGRREIWIEHHEHLYRLRITSQGRLILTK